MNKPEAVTFFADLFGGEHHIPGSGYGENNVKEYGHGFAVILHSGPNLATWDGDMLTRIVFLAHDRCMRAEITTAGRYMRLAIHPRTRERSFMLGHPTLEQAVSAWRANPNA
jgi:hypothetical protein